MANPSKAKGTAWETAVVDYLRANGHPHAERRALSGNTDRGDIAGVPGVVIECKNAKTMALAAWARSIRRGSGVRASAAGATSFTASPR